MYMPISTPTRAPDQTSSAGGFSPQALMVWAASCPGLTVPAVPLPRPQSCSRPARPTKNKQTIQEITKYNLFAPSFLATKSNKG